jgi:acyl-CoA synthetase (AMP-forming)/AMP-acid ligase II
LQCAHELNPGVAAGRAIRSQISCLRQCLPACAPPLDRTLRRGRVVDYKRLGDVVLCDAIPKTASGKILRRALRALDAVRRTHVGH